MTLRSILVLTVLLPTAALADHHEAAVNAIGAVLDDFHDAAANGDRQRYLGHLTERGVFMGTDEWERWPKEPDMRAYVERRFKDGQGWNYRPVERHVELGDSESVAWFDEVIYSEQNGRFRGTGVLSLQDGVWKIEHYAMSFLVFNEIWPEVVELNKKIAADKAGEAQ